MSSEPPRGPAVPLLYFRGTPEKIEYCHQSRAGLYSVEPITPDRALFLAQELIKLANAVLHPPSKI